MTPEGSLKKQLYSTGYEVTYKEKTFGSFDNEFELTISVVTNFGFFTETYLTTDMDGDKRELAYNLAHDYFVYNLFEEIKQAKQIK